MRILLVAIWVLALTTASALTVSAQDAPDLTGQYHTVGIDPGALAPYFGTTVIRPNPLGGYDVLQQIGSRVIRGTGALRDGTFQVSFPELGATATYELRPEGTLVGNWGGEGRPQIGSETLAPIP